MSKAPSVAKFKTPTCVLCRQRKLRCDGESPCGPCSRARTLVVCTFIPKTSGQLRSELPKGAACISCRQRKRRCDGILPCRTCTAASRAHECEYRDRPNRRGFLAEQDRRSLPDGASTCTSRSANTSPSYTPGYSSSRDLPPETEHTDSRFNLFLPSPGSSGLFNIYANDRPLSMSGGSSVANSFAFPYLPTGGNTSSIAFREVSLERASELFSVRNLFLDHCWHYGLNVTAEKRDALSRGDTSGALVAPVLVNICQLLGYLLANHSQSEIWQYFQGQTEDEAHQARITFDFLDRRDSRLDPEPSLQAYALLVLYYGMKGDIVMHTKTWTKLGDLIARDMAALGLDDIPSLDHTTQLDFSSYPRGTGQEALSTFSMIIFLELGRTLVWKLPPSLDPQILAKFRQLATRHRTGTEMNFMRAKSNLFLFDSRQLVTELGRSELGQPPSAAWSRRYWILIREIHTHLNVLNMPLLEVSVIHEAQVLTLKICIIFALAALIDLYAVFSPFQSEARSKHCATVEEMAAVCSVFSGRDFQYLDSGLGLCWSLALRPIFHDPDAQAAVARSQAGYQSALDIIRECRRGLSQATPYVQMEI
ncbi:hypothetical protein B0H17DRAFT_1027431 [Mycena rosella]|uniref:Zn(2)-C6 fungal-type domain-containing protein n=1 Tax=Mycena rosella TaxID=1033263 RepID=A0AAD7MCF4_MYCRO|nr:hypothetical protein B0H17DRAFT_1027431 [Mycena rosella]